MNEDLPRTRDDARKRGVNRYFTGVPCKNGHLSAKTIQGTCVECKRILDAKYMERPGKREAAILRARAHYKENREHHLAREKEKRIEQGEARREKQRAWYASNKKQIRERIKAQRNDEKRAKERAYRRIKYASDPVYAISCRLRSYIATSVAIFEKKGVSRPGAKIVLGCTFDEFNAHLEKQFLRGMSWDNRNDWHIDHIVPLSTASTQDEVLALFHYSNLRPMWANDNIKKSDQITHLI